MKMSTMRRLERIFGKKQVILKNNSSLELKRDFNIALNSIKAKSNSADFIDWYSMNQAETDELLNEVLKSDYVLSSNSHEFLTENIKVAIKSLEKDVNTIEFVDKKIKDHPFIFRCLILNERYRHSFSCSYLRNKSLKYFMDSDVIETVLKKLKVYKSDKNEYVERINKIALDVINNRPTVNSFDYFFQHIAEATWDYHRKNNRVDYDNIFGKICAELRSCTDFDIALDNLLFLDKMQEVLGEKYNVLYKAMKDYFQIYHNEENNMLEKISASKDMIASLSALYVSKCKENSKKEILDWQYNWLKPYFGLKLENPYVNKKIIQYRKKEQFKTSYVNEDKEVKTFIDGIVKTYSKTIDLTLIKELIYAFLVLDCSKLEDVIDTPFHYEEYERYEKATKLIKRLNSGYITYDGVEVLNYKDIISYDITKNQYVYTGIKFNENDLKNFSEYRKILQVFLKIKKDIMSKIKTVDFDGKIDDSIVENLKEELPFTDEYYEFNQSYVLNHFVLNSLKVFGVDRILSYVIVNEESFHMIYDLLVNKGLIWLMIFNRKKSNKYLNDGIDEVIFGIVNAMPKILELAKEFSFNTSDFGELLLAKQISGYADKTSLAILGSDIIGELCRNRDFIEYDDNKTVIEKAKNLICQMTIRNKSTVPYVSGKHLNYNYSLYDSQDETILLAGINTDACFRIGGNDNDFLHYCGLNKNGFVIKITDEFGNFIGRASGFRNGNCVYINQLRTVYDNFLRGGFCGYQTEREEIMKTLQTACNEIIETSINNPEEENKIEFVFVTQSYSMSCFKSNVPSTVEKEIGEWPMDIYSPNWDEFLEETSGLQEEYSDDVGFYTDYGNYSLICLAGIKSPEDLTCDDIKRGDVPALYERQRNKIVVSDKPTESLIKKVNKIQAIASWMRKSEFQTAYIPMTAKIFLGDNWYIIYDNNKVIDGILLADDEKAKVEFDAVMKILEDYTKEMNLAEFVSKSQTSNLSVEVESNFVKNIGTLQ